MTNFGVFVWLSIIWVLNWQQYPPEDDASKMQFRPLLRLTILRVAWGYSLVTVIVIGGFTDMFRMDPWVRGATSSLYWPSARRTF